MIIIINYNVIKIIKSIVKKKKLREISRYFANYIHPFRIVHFLKLTMTCGSVPNIHHYMSYKY